MVELANQVNPKPLQLPVLDNINEQSNIQTKLEHLANNLQD